MLKSREKRDFQKGEDGPSERSVGGLLEKLNELSPERLRAYFVSLALLLLPAESAWAQNPAAKSSSSKVSSELVVNLDPHWGYEVLVRQGLGNVPVLGEVSLHGQVYTTPDGNSGLLSAWLSKKRKIGPVTLTGAAGPTLTFGQQKDLSLTHFTAFGNAGFELPRTGWGVTLINRVNMPTNKEGSLVNRHVQRVDGLASWLGGKVGLQFEQRVGPKRQMDENHAGVTWGNKEGSVYAYFAFDKKRLAIRYTRKFGK